MVKDTEQKGTTKGSKWMLPVSIAMILLGGTLVLWDGGSEQEPEQGVEDASVDVVTYDQFDLSIEEREYSVDKSDRDISGVIDSEPKVAPNDATDSWYVVEQENGVDVTEYALSYADTYVEADSHVHWVINQVDNTTTSIRDNGDFLHVAIYEYLDGEEQDVGTLGTGMLIAEYEVYKDNGDVVDIHRIHGDHDSELDE